ncbi:MAG: hypothetical protein SNH27_12230 [Rikenellaceae bacterium]
MSRYTVLWIDDEADDEFLDNAYEDGIDIKVARCHNDGVRMLKDSSAHWDAVILDANCKISDSSSEAPSLDSLTESIKSITEFCVKERFIPWFIYTGGAYESFNSLPFMISKERVWDDRKFYNKPADYKILFDNLKRAADSIEYTKVKMRYSDVLCFEEVNSRLIKLLVEVERGEARKSECFNSIRKILEDIFRRCSKSGILDIEFKGTNLGECSKRLGELDLIPIHIKRSLHSCVEISNSCSHGSPLDLIVTSGEAPYLLRSTTYELLNIILWCRSLPTSQLEIEEMRERVKAMEVSPKKVSTGVVGIDDRGNYFCDKYLLQWKDMHPEDVDKEIYVRKSTPNNDVKTKDRYSDFVFRCNIEFIK